MLKLKVEDLRINYHHEEDAWVIVYVEKGAPLIYFDNISEAVDAMSAVQLGYMEMNFNEEAFEDAQVDVALSGVNDSPLVEGSDAA